MSTPPAPLVRYAMNEADMGQAVAELLDTAPNPLNLPLIYSPTSPVFVGPSPTRHLEFDGTGTGAGGVIDVAGTKLDILDGTSAVTVEVKYHPSDCTNTDWRIISFADGSTYDDRWFAIREDFGIDALWVSWSDVGLGRYALLGPAGAGDTCPIKSISVVHWVVEATHPTINERVRAYINGSRTTIEVTGDLPTTASRLDLNPAESRLSIGRPAEGNRVFMGTISFVALYPAALTDAQVAERAELLATNDD